MHDSLFFYVSPSLSPSLPQAFSPELLLVSSGYDAGFLDPLATMMLSSEHFRVLGQKLNGVAEEVCGGKIVYAHEVGGEGGKEGGKREREGGGVETETAIGGDSGNEESKPLGM